MDLIKEFIKRQSAEKIKVGIIGDIILDEYHQVIVERISPEFPIEILKSDSSSPHKTCFGGASNVANIISNFNVDCTLFGYTDKESLSVLSSNRFKCESVAIKSIPRKKRFYSDGFPLVRWDVEETSKNCEISSNELLNLISNYITSDSPNIIILSDYGKGVFSLPVFAKKIISLCRDFGIPTIVDPKGDPLHMWNGCNIFKVNKKEFDYFCQKLDASPDELINIINCDYLIVTNADEDIVVYGKNGKNQISYKHGKARSAVGAGDCVAAILALSHIHKFNIEECVIIAGLGSSAYVEKEWNEPITPYDLLKFIDPISSKIVTAEWLSSQNLNLILANGVFDLIGTHHLDLLKFAKSKADKLVVAVNSDRSVKNLKGENRPILPLSDRIQILSSLEFVDFVVPFDEDTPRELIRKIRPDMLIKGADYQTKNIAGREFVKEVILFPIQTGKSTTNIIEKIKCQK